MITPTYHFFNNNNNNIIIIIIMKILFGQTLIFLTHKSSFLNIQFPRSHNSMLYFVYNTIHIIS